MADAVQIDKPGVYALDASSYHADPCSAPSLSASIAKIIIGQSARHAWTQHPRLNPTARNEESDEFDLGTAVHAMLLEGGSSRVEVIDAENYRTNAAKEQRDAARAAGRIPLLPKHYEAASAMVIAARQQLAAHEDARGAFTDGRPEMTIVWREGDTWCRARLDWLPNKGRVFPDYKSTGTSAHPDDWGRLLFNMGYDMQAAFYRRGIRALLGIENPLFEFVVQETTPPYALSVVGLSPAAVNIGDAKVDEAIRLWTWCLKHDRWPGYPSRTAYVDPPAWHQAQWAERADRDLTVSGGDMDKLYRMAIEWQRPLGGKGEQA